MDKCNGLVCVLHLLGFAVGRDCAGEAAQGVARSGFPRAPAAQWSPFGAADCDGLARFICSLDLMRDLAVALLWRKRWDSLPVSTIWQ